MGYTMHCECYIDINTVTIVKCELCEAALDLYEALEMLLEHYLSLANSGDCGYWDTDKEIQVIKAREAIAKAEGG